MSILGLLNTEDFVNQRFKNYRQEVFYYMPNGSFPLTGLLSLMGDESTNDPSFHWWEKRTPQRITESASANSAGPFTTSGGDVDKTSGGWTAAAGGLVRLHVDSTDNFREKNVIMINGLTNDNADTDVELQLVVVSIVSGVTTKLECRILSISRSDDLLNTTANNDLSVRVIGSVYAEGDSQGSRSIHKIPTEIYNYTQILRKPFKMTETAARTSAKFDKTGPYKDRMKEAQIDHFKELEFSSLFGRRGLYTNSNTEAERTTGGIIWHLEQYEAANSIYRGGTGAAAITADSNDDKRIIENSGGTINPEDFDMYLERAFRHNRNNANQLLCLCGSGALRHIHTMYKNSSVLQADFPSKDAFGMNVMRHITPFGDVIYKTHPLFNEDATYRNWMLFLDTGNMKWRPLRDTKLRKNIQNNRDDFREDEWLTEGGVEFRSPESHLLLKNVTGVTP